MNQFIGSLANSIGQFANKLADEPTTQLFLFLFLKLLYLVNDKPATRTRLFEFKDKTNPVL